MKYPRIGEWIFSPELNREITAFKVERAVCESGQAQCVFHKDSGKNSFLKYCNVSSERSSCTEPDNVIYLDRATWPIARLTQGTQS